MTRVLQIGGDDVLVALVDGDTDVSIPVPFVVRAIVETGPHAYRVEANPCTVRVPRAARPTHVAWYLAGKRIASESVDPTPVAAGQTATVQFDSPAMELTVIPKGVR